MVQSKKKTVLGVVIVATDLLAIPVVPGWIYLGTYDTHIKHPTANIKADTPSTLSFSFSPKKQVAIKLLIMIVNTLVDDRSTTEPYAKAIPLTNIELTTTKNPTSHKGDKNTLL